MGTLRRHTISAPFPGGAGDAGVCQRAAFRTPLLAAFFCLYPKRLFVNPVDVGGI